MPMFQSIRRKVPTSLADRALLPTRFAVGYGFVTDVTGINLRAVINEMPLLDRAGLAA